MQVVPVLYSKIAEFSETLPVVMDLRNKDLQKHHWDQINEIFHRDIKV